MRVERREVFMVSISRVLIWSLACSEEQSGDFRGIFQKSAGDSGGRWRRGGFHGQAVAADEGCRHPARCLPEPLTPAPAPPPRKGEGVRARPSLAAFHRISWRNWYYPSPGPAGIPVVRASGGIEVRDSRSSSLRSLRRDGDEHRVGPRMFGDEVEAGDFDVRMRVLPGALEESNE